MISQTRTYLKGWYVGIVIISCINLSPVFPQIIAGGYYFKYCSLEVMSFIFCFIIPFNQLNLFQIWFLD